MIARGGILRVQSFHWHTVHLGYVGKGSVVFDLGAGVGRFAQAIAAETGCLCYAAEPNPHQFRLIPDDARINKYLMAIADRKGTVRFYVSQQPAASSILPVQTETIAQTIEVQATDLEGWVEDLAVKQVDLIKMDIEGAEIMVIESLSDEFLTSVRQLSIEFHDFNGLTPLAEVERAIRRLRSLGFFYIRMSRVGNQDTLFINRSACRISIFECLFIKYVSRNVIGLGRMVYRLIRRVRHRHNRRRRYEFTDVQRGHQRISGAPDEV